MVRRWFIVMVLMAVACTDKTVTSTTESTPSNEAPSAIVNSPYPGQEIPNGAFFVAWGEVSDPEDEPEDLLVSWRIADEERCAPSAPTEPEGRTKCEVSFSFDKQSILMQVSDSAGLMAEQIIDVRIVENTGPTVTITRPLPGETFRSTEEIPFEGTVSDGEDSPEGLTVWWETDQGDLLNEIGQIVSSDGRVSGSGRLSAAHHILRLFAVDTSGRQGEASVAVVVFPPETPPLVSIESPEDGLEVELGELVNFVAQVSDEMTPAEDLLIEWSSEPDTAILNTDAPASDGRVQFSTDALPSGAHEITLTVTDSDGEYAEDTVLIQVGTTDTDEEDTDEDDTDD